MKKILSLVAACCALSFGTAAHAEPTMLGSYLHDYGSAAGQVAPTSQGVGSCDVLGPNGVVVRSGNRCGRFNDVFDFSNLNYSSIDSIQLILNYTGARNELFFELWAPRPAYSASNGSTELATFMNGSGPQTWTFDRTNLEIFDEIVEAETFHLWFNNFFALGTNNFTLNSAELQIRGEAAVPPEGTVSSPGTLALLGAGLIGLGLSSGRKRLIANHRERRNEGLKSMSQTQMRIA